MTVRFRRVWRAAPATLVVLGLFVAATGIGIPGLAYWLYLREGSPWVPAFLLALAAAGLLYAWRYGLRPRLRADPEGLLVVNPFRRVRIGWAEINVIAPGENGLLIGTGERTTEVWCIQKSNLATRRGRRTRSDRIARQLYDLWERVDPPLTDTETGLRIRRARPDESGLLARLERAASESTLAHVFPPEEFRYPLPEVTRRWWRLLRDRRARTWVLEEHGEPVGFVACSADRVLHLGVLPQRSRRGLGSALLELATGEIFASGAGRARLWVLDDNAAAKAFFRAHGWRQTTATREAEFPPYPPEVEMVRDDPSLPRRRQ